MAIVIPQTPFMRKNPLIMRTQIVRPLLNSKLIGESSEPVSTSAELVQATRPYVHLKAPLSIKKTKTYLYSPYTAISCAFHRPQYKSTQRSICDYQRWHATDTAKSDRSPEPSYTEIQDASNVRPTLPQNMNQYDIAPCSDLDITITPF